MSSNVYNGKNLYADAYVMASGRPMLPPMILGPEFGEMPKDPPGAVMLYKIGNLDGGSLDLVDWEAILLPIRVLQDALHRELPRAGIRKPTPEQLDQLRDLVDKLDLIPPEERKA